MEVDDDGDKKKRGTACRRCKEVHAAHWLFIDGDWQGALNALCYRCYCEEFGDMSRSLSSCCDCKRLRSQSLHAFAVRLRSLLRYCDLRRARDRPTRLKH